MIKPEQTQRVKSEFIYPPLWTKALQLLEACAKRGRIYYLVSGYRSIPAQNELHAQGRTKPGPVVTNARGGFSFHNQGLALDFCLDKDQVREGLQPDWNPEAYEVLCEEAGKLGLESGLHWKFRDAPHIQWRLPAGVVLFNTGGPKPGVVSLLTVNPDGSKLQDVFSLLDRQSSPTRS